MRMSGVTRIVPNKSALFICDIQERFKPFIHAFPSVVKTADKMVRAAKILELPVVVTEQNPKVLGGTVPMSLDSLPQALRPTYSPLAKTKFSMVLPEVIASLKEWKTESVLLVGIESHVCVLQTTLDLLELGYGVHVLADGVSSCNREEVGFALERMRSSGAQITTSESALFELMVDSTHPQFRAVSGLVKETKAHTKDSLCSLCGSGEHSE